MPQLTNLNTFPYFDDFDSSKSFYKVLFKPGQPVQARELTTLQSTLQYQIESLGNHIFKEGSVVIPGTLTVRSNSLNINLNPVFNGLEVEQYINSLVGKIIVGQESGIRARIEVVDGLSCFVNVLSNVRSNFIVDEILTIEESINLTDAGITSFSAGSSVATIQSINSGCVAKLTNGIFFLRGYFVEVDDQTLVVTKTNSTPSFNLGFNVIESFVDSYDDESLYDNSQGFVNYAAPGADRLKLEAKLTSVLLGEETPQNFIELMKVENGVVKSSKIDNPEYNILADEMARRTFEESGNYYVKSFALDVKNSLNDYKGNDGVYDSSELTSSGEVPRDDLGVYKLSSGKAYINGYEVNIPSNILLDFKKPRDTKEFKNQSVAYLTGPTISLNNVYGAPKIGLSTSYTVSLRDQRIGAAATIAAGKEIGLARVYDYALETGSYDTTNTEANTWDLALFDVQPFTDIIVNENITSLQTPAFIQGKASGAVGYLRYDVQNSGIVTAYNVKGNFIKGEELIFDGVDAGRIAIAATAYSISNVKSVHGEIGITTFSGDVKQSIVLELGPCTIDVSGNVTQADRDFTKDFKINDLVSFKQAAESLPNIARVISVSSSQIGLAAVESIAGICIGSLPGSQIDLIDVNKIETSLQISGDNTLYTTLPKSNVASVDLSNSHLTVRKSFNTTITSDPTGGRITILPQDIETGETFLPFDEERYIVVNKNGVTEVLTSDKFTITSGGRELIIKGLSVTGSATLIATLKKTQIKSKNKVRNRVKTIIIDKSNNEGSGIGATTLNDGLTYGNYPYGTRVQDKDICLLEPDITKIYGIYESSTTGNPILPILTLTEISSFNSDINDALTGEEIIGETSGCVAILESKINSSSINIVPINGKKFVIGEKITFNESSITATVDFIADGSNNITGRYDLVSGSKNTIYDYSKIVRKTSTQSPTKKISISYEYASINSTDTGNILTANSYENFNYCDIPSVNGYRYTDIIDNRPRVATYTVSENSRSPFEFLGRNFASEQNSNLNVLASDESIILNYSIYLPRIDRIYLSKDKNFQLVYGTPNESPQPPIPIDDALEIAIVSLPAYLCRVQDAKINLLSHKRYQMRDIAKLEDRIKNLEYYTTLSLLETNTANLEVKDSQGTTRFKSGFFVDNFTSTNNQQKFGPKNSIDPVNNELRPSTYTTELDLLLGSTSLTGVGGTKDETVDARYVTDLIGSNIRRSTVDPNGSSGTIGMGLLTLDYQEVEFISQENATRVVNAAPYFVNFYKGTIALNPSSDIWISQSRIETLTVEGLLGGYSVTNIQATPNDLDPQSGWSPILWGGWNEEWTGTSTRDRTLSASDSATLSGGPNQSDGSVRANSSITVRETTRTGTATQAGLSSRVQLVPGNNLSLGDRIVSSNVSSFMRSRNIEIVAKKLKPLTELFAFFDSTNVTRYCVPKLIEIEMISGTFEIGEEVIGGTLPGISEDSPYIQFRVSDLNHRSGPYNDPLDVYPSNPYTGDSINDLYSTSSTLLNVDTSSLSIQSQSQFYGYVQSGMILRGQSSGARARITNLRLTTDETGSLVASFYIPNPNAPATPKFRNGNSTLKLTDVPSLSAVEGLSSTGAEMLYFASGQVDQVQGTILSTRNVEVTNAYTQQSRSISETTESLVDINLSIDATLPQPVPIPRPQPVPNPVPRPEPQPRPNPRPEPRPRPNPNPLPFPRPEPAVQSPRPQPRPLPAPPPPQPRPQPRPEPVPQPRPQPRPRPRPRPQPRPVPAPEPPPLQWWQIDDWEDDPIAQSFVVGNSEDSTGIFVTSVSLYFQSTAPNETCFVELRPMVNGLPSSEEIYPLSRVILNGSEIEVSEDGSVLTLVTFPAPVYLEGNKEHCIVVGSNTTSFNLWVSRMGEVDVSNLALPESQQIPITKQSTLGSLFKSQNGRTWTPSQYEDLKFKLQRANFTDQGQISFFNPDLSRGNSHIPTLKKDSLDVVSRKIIVGLGTTARSWGTEIVPGNTVIQDDSNASGNYVTGLGIATGTMTVVNSGIGFTPSAGFYGYSNVTLTKLTGDGQNATADIHVNNGVAIAATIASGGNGFKVGDILTATIGDGVGRNLQLSVSEIYGINELVLDQVQGNFSVGTGKTLRYINSSGVTTEFSNNASVTLNASPRVINDGLHIKVNHLNHGMHSQTNNVIISNVSSDIPPVRLDSDYGRTLADDIIVTDASEFASFEGVGVGTTNPGYIQIGSEIISYTGVTGNTLEGITRGIDSSVSASYDDGELVYKYENSGVSLRRINKEHQLQDATVNEAIGLDHYTIKIDTSTNGVDRSTSTSFPVLYLNETKSSGGDIITATQNIQYEIMKPIIQTLTLQKTNVSARARTVTATSVSGNEVSFEDAGYSSINLDSDNYFDTPRLIASNVNSDNLLTTLPGGKSFEIEMRMRTFDSRLSPVIDLDRVGAIFVSNRVNSVITDYSSDPRVSSLTDDPSAFTYAVKPIELEIPANNLKIILAAYINNFSDIRALYAITNDPSEELIYYPFPGYDNLLESGQVIDLNDNNGKSDSFVSPTDNKGFQSTSLTFKDYEFTIESLPSFKYFSIKLIATSTNQCYPPRIRDLRVIATA